MQDRTDTPARALWSAACHGDRETIVRLITDGVDVNTWDTRGRTALSFAAGGNHVDIARDLLAAGAWVDPHENGDVFDTPLIAAANGGHHEMVALLLKHGANPTHYGGFSIATAEYYARHSHPAVSELLRAAEEAWRKRQHGNESD